MIEFENIFKIFLRFLKEEGVYHRVLSIYGRDKRNVKDVLKRDLCFTHWIQHEDTFCLWQSTGEGRDFWWLIHLLWLIKCLDICGGIYNFNGHYTFDEQYVRMTIKGFLDVFSPFDNSNKEMREKLIEKSTILKKYIDYE